MITNKEADVLSHTARTGRYVTDEALVIDMGQRGLLFDHGPQRLADGMHYLVMTGTGRTALNEWRDAQPKPIPQKKRRCSPAFQHWREHRGETFDTISFSEFLKTVWPQRRDRFAHELAQPRNSVLVPIRYGDFK